MTRTSLADLGDTIAFCDPAAGRQSGRSRAIKAVGSRSAIVVIAADWLSRIFVLHTWAERCSTDRLCDKILAINRDFSVRLFGIEANAMQSLFADAMLREARYKGQRLPLVPVTQPAKIDKTWRIKAALEPLFPAGRLFVQPAHLELKHEIVSFPMSPMKDLVDALASAVALVPRRPAAQARNEELEARLRYLRETGAPAWHVEQVAAGRA